ncbi:MAG TPA: hypothetical protein VJB98_02080 [Candidatus Paceibacterota bacterium]
MQKPFKYPTVQLPPLTNFVYDKTLDGWELIEDVPLVGNERLEIIDVTEIGENFLVGDEFLGRAKKIGRCAGQRHAEQLSTHIGVPENWELRIPASWGGFHLLFFPGTVWKEKDGSLYIPSIHISGGFEFSYLGFGYSDNCRTVHVKKNA